MLYCWLCFGNSVGAIDIEFETILNTRIVAISGKALYTTLLANLGGP